MQLQGNASQGSPAHSGGSPASPASREFPRSLRRRGPRNFRVPAGSSSAIGPWARCGVTCRPGLVYPRVARPAGTGEPRTGFRGPGDRVPKLHHGEKAAVVPAGAGGSRFFLSGFAALGGRLGPWLRGWASRERSPSELTPGCTLEGDLRWFPFRRTPGVYGSGGLKLTQSL